MLWTTGFITLNIDDKNTLYKIKTDGTEKTKIDDFSSGRINIAGDWIFYLYYSGTTAPSQYKIKTDGTSNTAVE